MYPSIKSEYFSKDPTQFLYPSSNSSATVKSGYYCKTATNTPLIGSVTRDNRDKTLRGLYVCAGVSGFGVMCSQAAGELVAMQVLQNIGAPIRSEREIIHGMRGLKYAAQEADVNEDEYFKSLQNYNGEFDPMIWMGKQGGSLQKQVDGSLRSANQL